METKTNKSKADSVKWKVNYTAFRAIFRRDLKVFFSNFRHNMLRVILQPLFFIIVFGFMLTKGGVLSSDFSKYMVPGLITIGVMFSAGFGVVALVGLSFFRDKEIRSQIKSPISTELLGLEKIIYGTFQGVISGLIVLVLSWLILRNSIEIIFPDFLHILLFLVVLVLTGIIFASLGLIVSSVFRIPALMFESFNLAVTTFMFFGGTFFSLELAERISPFLKYFLFLIPNVYTNEAIRGMIIPGVESLSVWYCILGLLIFAVLTVYLGIKAFKKR